MVEWKNGRAAARRGCGSQSRVRLAAGIRDNGRFGSRRGLHGNARGVRGDVRFGLFFDAHQVLIGNLPAEVAVLAALLEILLEEDGTAGISDENAGSGQKNITSAILHLHTTPEKG